MIKWNIWQTFVNKMVFDWVPAMDRREVSGVFRARLLEAMARANTSQAALARRVGISRSTVAQLLSTEVYRLPRADTVAAVATELKVSLDWLLGLSQVDKLGADILHESLQVAPNARQPVDEQLIAWFEEAAEAKIRYVPGTLPDFAKTGDMLRHEYRTFSARSLDRALALAREKFMRLRMSETDMEVCMPVQRIEDFVEGSRMWRALSAASRVQQIERLVEVVEELYPRLRVYLFDGLTHYSIPYSIYGRRRVSLYAGQIHLVFNTAEHISVMNRQFDDLIRAAVVHSIEVGPYLCGLLPRIREHG